MISKRLNTTSVVSYDDMFMLFTQQFLHSFEELAECDFQEGTYLDFKIKERSNKKRINPIIRLATPEDIDEIIFIYKDVYIVTIVADDFTSETEILHAMNTIEDCLKDVIDAKSEEQDEVKVLKGRITTSDMPRNFSELLLTENIDDLKKIIEDLDSPDIVPLKHMKIVLFSLYS